MALKATVDTVDQRRTETMEFEIEGLEQVSEGVFRMRNVPVIEVHWPTIGETLEKAGLKQADCERYVDILIDEVTKDQTAKLFAQRAKRIA